LVIIFGKIVQRLVEPGAFFFGDICSGFDGDVVLLGKAVDGGDNRTAPVNCSKVLVIVAGGYGKELVHS
jgi:hypothetical protein